MTENNLIPIITSLFRARTDVFARRWEKNCSNLIRNEGRQAFLEQQPAGFSWVLYDYSDEKKGFVVWKGMVEERMV